MEVAADDAEKFFLKIRSTGNVFFFPAGGWQAYHQRLLSEIDPSPRLGKELPATFGTGRVPPAPDFDDYAVWRGLLEHFGILHNGGNGSILYNGEVYVVHSCNVNINHSWRVGARGMSPEERAARRALTNRLRTEFHCVVRSTGDERSVSVAGQVILFSEHYDAAQVAAAKETLLRMLSLPAAPIHVVRMAKTLRILCAKRQVRSFPHPALDTCLALPYLYYTLFFALFFIDNCHVRIHFRGRIGKTKKGAA